MDLVVLILNNLNLNHLIAIQFSNWLALAIIMV